MQTCNFTNLLNKNHPTSISRLVLSCPPLGQKILDHEVLWSSCSTNSNFLPESFSRNQALCENSVNSSMLQCEVAGIAAVHQSWQLPQNKFSLIRINPAPGAMCLPISPAQLSLTFWGSELEILNFQRSLLWVGWDRVIWQNVAKIWETHFHLVQVNNVCKEYASQTRGGQSYKSSNNTRPTSGFDEKSTCFCLSTFFNHKRTLF